MLPSVLSRWCSADCGGGLASFSTQNCDWPPAFEMDDQPAGDITDEVSARRPV
jgi:hypothetical protein